MHKEIFVPGRLCLFGEHSDWAGGYRREDKSITSGYCLAIGTDQGIYAEVLPHPDKFIIRSTDIHGKEIGTQEFSMDEESLMKAAKGGGFFSYCVGFLWSIITQVAMAGFTYKDPIIG